MRYNTPQFIDIEDRIVGPLTGKQLLWMFAMAGAVFLLWFSIQNRGVFLLVSVPVSLVFVAFAFYRPYGQSLSQFVGSVIMYLLKPKIYTWDRDGEYLHHLRSRRTKAKGETGRKAYHRLLKKEEIENLAMILDSETDILKEINKNK